MDRVERAKTWGLRDPLDEIEFSEEDDFIGEFLEELELKGRRPKTVHNYEEVLRSFEKHLRKKCGGVHVGKATDRHVYSWKKELVARELKDSTLEMYLTSLASLYNFLVKNRYYPHTYNPATKVRSSVDRSDNGWTIRRETNVEEVGDFVRSVKHPRDRAMIVLMLKTGIRRGELANLKIQHVTLDDDLKEKYPALKPMSIFVDAKVVGSKRKMNTIIPIDDECVRALATWMAVRPGDSTDALFVRLNYGTPINAEDVTRRVREWAKRFGWWDPDADLTTNVTPHYFRHFFTSHMRKRGMDEPLLAYLRGDTGKSVMDIYTHYGWDDIREQYDRCIYKFGI